MSKYLFAPGLPANASSDPYSEENLWKTGELCQKGDKCYKYIGEDMETGEEWTPAHWEETNLTSEITNLQSQIDQINENLIDTIYPVGSIYISISSTSPSTLFSGTTWEQLKDRFLLGAGDTYSANATGGAASVSYTPAGTVGGHTLTVTEIPSHNHSFTGSAVTSGKVSAGHTHSGPSHTHTGPSHTHTGPSHSHTMSHTHAVYLYATNVAAGSGTSVYQVGGSNWYTGNSNTGGSSASSTGAGGTGATGAAGTGNTGSSGTGATGGQSADHTHSVTASGSIGNKGGGGAHNHGFTGTAATINTMPPYLTVYMWKRTA